jgi:hypothetical protein
MDNPLERKSVCYPQNMQDNGNSESEIPSDERQVVKPLVKAGSWLILLVVFLPLILIIAPSAT